MGLFYGRVGRGLSKEDVDKKGVALYLDILGRRVWSLITLNMLYLALSLPAVILSFLMSAYILNWVIALINLQISPIIAEGLNFLSVLVSVALLTFCGSGPASAGIVTVLRKHVEDTHSWGWSDFFDGFKKNFGQTLIIYIINILATNIFVVSFFHYSYVMKGALSGVLAIVVAVVAVIFFMMQMYTYQLSVCMKLKTKDIYKNALMLVMGKLPWNILVGIITIAIMIITYEMFLALVPAGVVLVFGIFFSFIYFTQVFMTNKILTKYVIEPSKEKANETKE